MVLLFDLPLYTNSAYYIVIPEGAPRRQLTVMLRTPNTCASRHSVDVSPSMRNTVQLRFASHASCFDRLRPSKVPVSY